MFTALMLVRKLTKTYTPYLKVCIPVLRTIGQLMFEYLNYNKYRFTKLQGGYVFSLGWKWWLWCILIHVITF